MEEMKKEIPQWQLESSTGSLRDLTGGFTQKNASPNSFSQRPTLLPEISYHGADKAEMWVNEYSWAPILLFFSFFAFGPL